MRERGTRAHLLCWYRATFPQTVLPVIRSHCRLARTHSHTPRNIHERERVWYGRRIGFRWSVCAPKVPLIDIDDWKDRSSNVVLANGIQLEQCRLTVSTCFLIKLGRIGILSSSLSVCERFLSANYTSNDNNNQQQITTEKKKIIK